MIKDITLETDRLILRKFNENDSKKCYKNYGQDKELGRYLPMYPVKTLEAMTAMVKGFIGAYESGTFIWLIEEKSTREPMGYISVDVPYEELGIGEIAYLLGVQYQGKGYAFEAVSAVIGYMLYKEQLYMIEAKYNENNTASAHLLDKLGFTKDGVLRERRIDRLSGERCHLVICSIKREEYK